MYTCIHVYMYTYIHTCIHTYIHTYSHTHTHGSLLVQQARPPLNPKP